MSSDSPLREDLFTRLRHGLDNFSNQQQLVCQFIIDHYQEVAFMTVEELSQACGASPATVVRTVASLNYESFHQLLQEIQSMFISSTPPPWWQKEKPLNEGSTPELTSEGKALVETARQNVESIQESLSPLLMEKFKLACDLLKKSRKLSILGLRSGRGAAMLCYSMFHQFLDNVSLSDSRGTEEMYWELLNLTSNDVILAIAAEGPHYAYRTIEAIEFAHERNIPVVLITSDRTCPAAPLSDVVLNISSTTGHLSLVPVLTVVEALAAELEHHHKDRPKGKRRTFEKLLVDKKITL